MGKCEVKVGSKRCGRPADVFAAGWWRCAAHPVRVRWSCGHALVGSERCGFCGQVAQHAGPSWIETRYTGMDNAEAIAFGRYEDVI